MPTSHVPEWPDKAMFAALLLMMSGTLGFLFGALEMAGANIHLPDALEVAFLDEIPPWYHTLLCGLTVVLGALSLLLQRRRFAWLGAGTALVSMAALGVVGLCVPFVVGNLVKSWREGEQRGRRFRADEWPDKTMAASLFLLIGSLISLVQGISIATRHFDPVWLDQVIPHGAAVPLAAIFDIAAAPFCLVASRAMFWQRLPWLGWVSAVALLLGAGFYVIGPALAALAMLSLALGHAEKEFLPIRSETAESAE